MGFRWVAGIRNRFSQMSALPRLLAAGGCLILSLSITQAVFTYRVGGSFLQILIDLVLVGIPGIALLYTGFWLPTSKIERRYYPRIIAWLLGGVVVMFGFVILRDLHPGVTVEWSLGTQAIALTIGSIGGLLIGIQETRATMQTHQLEQRERELERQNDQLNQFASVVSHDLRNPLSVAEGRLYLLREEYDNEHIESIGHALSRMNELIDDLLMLAREGNRVSDTEPVELGGIIQDCWRTVETGEATIITEIDGDIRADRSRLQQLLENLFRNAIEHGGTDVEITVGKLKDGFYVEDDGPGIPEDDREEAFEAGYSTSVEGTGFGLSIVEQVAEAHGWQIRVTEGSNGGARFEITDVDFAE